MSSYTLNQFANSALNVTANTEFGADLTATSDFSTFRCFACFNADGTLTAVVNGKDVKVREGALFVAGNGYHFYVDAKKGWTVDFKFSNNANDTLFIATEVNGVF